MAGESGLSSGTVTRRLLEDPTQFDFFQAVRRLECELPDKPRVGHSVRSSDDAIRFCQEPSLGFAPSTLHHFEPARGSLPPRLFVNFFGLLGPNGPLPLHLTEYICDRLRNHRDATFARFLDLFHHRMISFFYRAWAASRPTVNHDRGAAADPFAQYVGSLFGIGMESFRQRDAVPDVAKLHFSGHLACQTRHADGLRSVLAAYFATEVSVEQFVGQWIDLPPEYRCRLGESPATGGLGTTAVVGSRVWDCQQKISLRMGPMPLARLQQFLPGTPGYAQLRDWVRNYAGDTLDWEARLVLIAADVPTIQLGKAGALGWTSWLKTTPFKKDADDLVLRPGAA